MNIIEDAKAVGLFFNKDNTGVTGSSKNLIKLGELIKDRVISGMQAGQSNQANFKIDFITENDIADLKRFVETAADDGTYSIHKERMQHLASTGLVRHLSAGIYEITTFGERVLANKHAENEQLGLSTIEKVREALSRAGYSTGEDGLEGFSAKIERHVLALCHHVIERNQPQLTSNILLPTKLNDVMKECFANSLVVHTGNFIAPSLGEQDALQRIYDAIISGYLISKSGSSDGETLD